MMIIIKEVQVKKICMAWLGCLGGWHAMTERGWGGAGSAPDRVEKLFTLASSPKHSREVDKNFIGGVLVEEPVATAITTDFIRWLAAAIGVYVLAKVFTKNQNKNKVCLGVEKNI